jgi:hypothetical protein
MLGKQGWQLLTNQDTILSRVFKAKYYPKTGFLEANLGHNPSHAWRCIHVSQVVVRRGLRWRLGNGNSINVWKHPWLRNDNYTHVTTTMMVGREDMRVAELVNYETGTWNTDLIQQMFTHRDVAEITRLPLNLLNQEDAPIWSTASMEITRSGQAIISLWRILLTIVTLKHQVVGRNYGILISQIR